MWHIWHGSLVCLTKKRWFGRLTVFPLHPHAGEDAKRVIVSARKERYGPLKLKTGLIIHKNGGAYTEQAEEVLSRGGVLPGLSVP